MQLDNAKMVPQEYTFESVVNEIDQSGISSICRTVNKFNQIMDDDNVTSKNRDLETLVKHDINLATEILKVANSPLFRTYNKRGIDNISNAIMMIGWDTIYKIGMSIAIKGLVKNSKTRTFAGWMINRSILVSHVGEIFLESLKPYNEALKEIKSIYAYGLLQDIGAIGMLQVIEDYQQDVIENKLLDNKKNWSDAEKLLYGFDHNMVGEQILLNYQLPISFSIVARFHHDPEYFKHTGSESKKIALLRLAQFVLIDPHSFSDHEAFCHYKTTAKDTLIREYDDFSEEVQEEFETQLGLTSDIYQEIKSNKLTDSFINKISQEFKI